MGTMINIGELLREMYNMKASDLILKVGSPPIVRVYGDLQTLGGDLMTDDDARVLLETILTDEQKARFGRNMELDVAISVPDLARFRVNIFRQRRHMGFVFRCIPTKIPTLDELQMPPILKELAMRPRGLVLVTGPAGCGKSTTVAAMVEYRNSTEPCHILTVEDPVEFIYGDKLAMVNQREVGKDTRSFANALKYALRQDPDVIVIGEMRDLETIQLAVTAAETGHLVLSTLHTTDVINTIDRIIDVFPPHKQKQIRLQVSANLVGVVSQVLLKKADESGMIAATEIMITTAAIRNLIRDSKTHQIPSIIQTRTKEGMRTLNASLVELVTSGEVIYYEAHRKSPRPEEFREMMKKARAEKKTSS